MAKSVSVIRELKKLATESSRSIRENIVKFSPFLALISSTAFLIDATTDAGAFFLLFYMMMLVFFYLFTVLAVQELRGNFSEAEKYRYPPEIVIEPTSLWQRLKQFSLEFYHAEPKYDPLSEYEYETILPNITYIAHSLFWTLVFWVATLLGLNFLIDMGVYDGIIEWLVNGEWRSIEIATALLSYASGILIVFAEFLFPNVTLENRVVLITMVLIPGFFFLTAARNLIRLCQKLNRWFLLWIYDQSHPVRKREIVGYAALSIIYWGIFEVLV